MIKFALPVILSSDKEIKTFLNTKRELESNYDISVGAFVMQSPKTLTDENFQKQIRNYNEYKNEGLEVYHVQAPIEQENCILTKGPLLEKTIELCSAFTEEFLINYHMGLVLTSPQEVTDYVNKKHDYFALAIKNFRELNTQAGKYGLKLSIENEPVCFVQPIKGKNNVIEPNLFPYFEYVKLSEIASSSGMKLCFDTSHYASSRLSQQYLTGTSSEQLILQMTDCKSWGGINRLIGSWNKWIENASVYHLSNVTGIGCHLRDYNAKKWGEDGVVQGELSIDNFRHLLKNNKILNLELEVNLQDKTRMYERHTEFIDKLLN